MKSFPITEAECEKLTASIKKARIVPAPENSLGQWIGYLIDVGTSVLLEDICHEINGEGEFQLEPAPKFGDPLIRLKNTLGQDKQIDHVIKIDGENVLIVESKWLKDQRHLNDKGSWVLMMTDILLENKSLRGIVTVLAGPWESMRDVIEKRAKVVIIPIDKVYTTLANHGITITIELKRNAYEHAGETLNILLDKIEERISQGYNFVKETGYEILIDSKRELKIKILELLTAPVKIINPPE